MKRFNIRNKKNSPRGGVDECADARSRYGRAMRGCLCALPVRRLYFIAATEDENGEVSEFFELIFHDVFSVVIVRKRAQHTPSINSGF